MALDLANRKTYWATDPPHELIETLEDKTRDYFKQVKNGVYWRRVLRNLAYYHGLYYDDASDVVDMELKALGKQGEFVGLVSNHFREFIQHLITIITRDALALSTRATNTDNKSQEMTKIGKSLVDYYVREKNLDTYGRSAVEHGALFGDSFIESRWNERGGKYLDDSGRYEGDVEHEVHTRCSCIYDLSHNDFKKANWVQTKSYVNRWDLAERYKPSDDEGNPNPNGNEDIYQAIIDYEEDKDTVLEPYKGTLDIGHEDLIPIFRFYHKRTDSVPTGRYCEYIPGKYLLDRTLKYRDIPVRRFSFGEWVMTSLGFTPGFDLQGLQEMLNGTLSSIASAVSAFGIQDIWIPEGSEKIRTKLFEGGLRAIISAQKPEALNLLKVATELMNFPDMLDHRMERVTGINSVVRGDPEKSLKSGEALKVVEAKAYQFASGAQFSYASLMEDVGTDLIRIIEDFAQEGEQRPLLIIGKANEAYYRSFLPEDLKLIDRVVVDVVNPLSKGHAGKSAMIQDLMALGELKTKEQYKEVLQTGNMDSLFESDNAQLSKIREENELILQGIAPPPPSPTDHQVLHIREHAATQKTIENSLQGSPVRLAAEAHEMAHVQLLLNFNVQRIQEVLGYPVPQTFIPVPGQVTQLPQESGQEEQKEAA